LRIDERKAAGEKRSTGSARDTGFLSEAAIPVDVSSWIREIPSIAPVASLIASFSISNRSIVSCGKHSASFNSFMSFLCRLARATRVTTVERFGRGRCSAKFYAIIKIRIKAPLFNARFKARQRATRVPRKERKTDVFGRSEAAINLWGQLFRRARAATLTWHKRAITF